MVVLTRCAIALGLSAAAIAAQQPAAPANASVGSIDAELAQKLLSAKRVFVDSFGESALDKTLAATVSDAIRDSRRFIVTENRAKADLILKGAALEKTSQELHSIGSATSVAGASGSTSGGFGAHAAGIDDAQSSTETINDVRIAVRLVTPDGDVAWSTTQESRGGKYRSATADVADKVVKELARELDRLSKAKTEVK